MQTLVNDLGTTEILELYGKHLRAARDRNAELEQVRRRASGRS